MESYLRKNTNNLSVKRGRHRYVNTYDNINIVTSSESSHTTDVKNHFVTGPTGSRGVGEPGPTGSRGMHGPVGDTGPAGNIGPTGEHGPMGDIGTGPTGETGPTGPVGEVVGGPTGDNGPTGEVGPVGEQGPTGEVGPVGEQGPTVEVGPVGEQGLQGPAGEQGPTSEVGPTGTVDLTSDMSFSGNLTFNNPLLFNYLPNLTNINNLGFQEYGTPLNTSTIELSSDYTSNVQQYSKIELVPGVWFIESTISLTSSCSSGNCSAYASLSTVSEINDKNAKYLSIPLNNRIPYKDSITTVFTVKENTTVYTIINFLNAQASDENNNPITPVVTFDSSPIIVATRIA
jgi:hypothetical protein